MGIGFIDIIIIVVAVAWFFYDEYKVDKNDYLKDVNKIRRLNKEMDNGMTWNQAQRSVDQKYIDEINNAEKKKVR
ncbi:hypothetical protein [Leuconostoc pseudomesenteroides]|uniref:hypothetical protein n=1 Tax=Leuconostoc pseudomesenteroides TaxID=33968 RepID=UPI0032DFF4B3